MTLRSILSRSEEMYVNIFNFYFFLIYIYDGVCKCVTALEDSFEVPAPSFFLHVGSGDRTQVRLEK